MPSWRDVARALSGRDNNPDGDSFFCGKASRGGNPETAHPKARVHICILEPDHRNIAGSPTKHRCNCGWEWRR